MRFTCNAGQIAVVEGLRFSKRTSELPPMSCQCSSHSRLVRSRSAKNRVGPQGAYASFRTEPFVSITRMAAPSRIHVPDHYATLLAAGGHRQAVAREGDGAGAADLP